MQVKQAIRKTDEKLTIIAKDTSDKTHLRLQFKYCRQYLILLQIKGVVSFPDYFFVAR